jgi:hypothetical protein
VYQTTYSETFNKEEYISLQRKVEKDCLLNENSPFLKWMREPDLNQRPSGYEPDELT